MKPTKDQLPHDLLNLLKDINDYNVKVFGMDKGDQRLTSFKLDTHLDNGWRDPNDFGLNGKVCTGEEWLRIRKKK